MFIGFGKSNCGGLNPPRVLVDRQTIILDRRLLHMQCIYFLRTGLETQIIHGVILPFSSYIAGFTPDYDQIKFIPPRVCHNMGSP